MKHLLRPYRGIGLVTLSCLGAGMVMGPPHVQAQSTQMVELLSGTSPLLLKSSSSQGYLGVDLADVDQDKAQALKLKEVRGAVITLIDHDAPAGQIGLKVNDVVLQLNGQNVEGAEQLKRMLREIPAGHKVSLEFSRDGNLQTTSVELVDRREMERSVWNKLGNDSDTLVPAQGMGVLSGGGDASLQGMFRTPIFGSTLNVGALVEPLSGQTAELLGVTSGLWVKQVTHKSEAAAAGFKPHDVILKVGPDAVTTISDWDRSLRANQGKPVQVTILREKKQQVLTLQVDSKHKTGDLQMENLFPSAECQLMAGVNPDAAQFSGFDQQAVEQLSEQAQKLRDEAQVLNDQIESSAQMQMNSQQMQDLLQQTEKLGGDLKLDGFKVDPQQMDELKRQMKDLNLDDFKIDQKQADELKRQMEEFQKNFSPETLQLAPN
jgi:serine protease Do